jgi:signal transduction histidine kinase
METFFLPPDIGRKLRPYFFSFLTFLLALILREALTPIVGMSLPHATFMVAIAFSAWFFGLGPGLFTMIAGLPAADYFFTPPIPTWSAFTPVELPSTFTYLVASCALIAMGVANRRRAAELEEKNARLRELSAHLLRSQDEERRRIARELHDSVGQYLAAICMTLGRMINDAKDLPAAMVELLGEAVEISRACASEVRTISHLLHPPLLEEMGLSSAVRSYAEGFATRSAIQVQLDVPNDLHRFGTNIELALFRVLQESLTNVHRHSGSKIARVTIGADAHQVWLEVRDRGKGIPQKEGRPAFRPGVGTSGMQERIKELAGTLEFSSDQTGTLVKAVIPLPAGPHSANTEPTVAQRRVS